MVQRGLSVDARRRRPSEDELNILLADDDPALRRDLALLIGCQSGMNLVAVVASGAEALTAVDRMPIDVALLDVEMPGVSGVETAAVIRREHPEVTVVMLTAFERPGRLDEAIAAGVHGFLTKDTPTQDILEHVRQARAGRPVVTSTALGALLRQRRSDLASRHEFDDFVRRVEALPTRLVPVYNALAQGKSNQQIAREVFMQESTVRSYVSALLTQLDCANRSQVAYRTGRSGIRIPRDPTARPEPPVPS